MGDEKKSAVWLFEAARKAGEARGEERAERAAQQGEWLKCAGDAWCVDVILTHVPRPPSAFVVGN